MYAITIVCLGGMIVKKCRVWCGALLLAALIIALTACQVENPLPSDPPVCKHEFGTWRVESEATCKNSGKKIRDCERCGYREEEKIAVLGHDFVVDTAVEATCEKPGLTEGKHCARCGLVMVEQKSIYLEHKYGEGTIIQEPTCVTEGVRSFTCEYCGDGYTEEIRLVAHNYTGIITTEATCAVEGVKTYTCSGCNNSYTETIEKTSHVYTSAITTAATCAVEGVRTYTCTGCGDSYTETIRKTDHDYSGKVTKTPTCTKDGVKTFTCSGCDGSYTETIPANGHNYGNATCTTASTCSQCGATTGKALGHDWKSATCTEAKKCRRCQKTDGSALGHDYKGQTCTTDGACTRCNKKAAATGHKYSNGKCVNCGADDPNKVYTMGETWIVDGQWEFTVNSVEVHRLCNSYSNDREGYTNEMVVVINYTYKNLGYQNTNIDLWFSSISFDVYDGEGEAAETYACTHDKGPKECIVGMKCTASQAYVLSNDSNTITLKVNERECTVVNGENKRGEEREAVFKLEFGNQGGTSAWDEDDLEDLYDAILRANAFSYSVLTFADNALSATDSTSQQFYALSATNYASECKAQLNAALRLARSGPEIKLNDGKYATLVEALEALYDEISTVCNLNVTSSNWKTVATKAKSAATNVEDETMDLLNQLGAWD